MGVVQAVYHFKNAAGKERYSAFDIVEEGEEPDPLNRRFGTSGPEAQSPSEGGELRFCPYCGAPLGDGFTFCGRCGKKLPDGQ